MNRHSLHFTSIFFLEYIYIYVCSYVEFIYTCINYFYISTFRFILLRQRLGFYLLSSWSRPLVFLVSRTMCECASSTSQKLFQELVYIVYVVHLFLYQNNLSSFLLHYIYEFFFSFIFYFLCMIRVCYLFFIISFLEYFFFVEVVLEVGMYEVFYKLIHQWN